MHTEPEYDDQPADDEYDDTVPVPPYDLPDGDWQ